MQDYLTAMARMTCISPPRHDWLAEENTVPFIQDFYVKVNLFQLLESTLEKYL